VPKANGRFGFDGTTGRNDYGGRRTHIIQLLRDTRTPLSVPQVAEAVGVHVNTARFHLESLVDSGLAQRSQQPRSTPGRPRVLYVGTLPNQTHERAQGYRLLAETLTQTVQKHFPEPSRTLYDVGLMWGHRLAELNMDVPESESDRIDLLISKLDALWFAPELVARNDAGAFTSSIDESEWDEAKTTAGKDADHAVIFHHCPFVNVAEQDSTAVCSLHAGLMNGLLDEMGSDQRAVAIHPWVREHQCFSPLARVKDSDVEKPIPVVEN